MTVLGTTRATATVVHRSFALTNHVSLALRTAPRPGARQPTAPTRVVPRAIVGSRPGPSVAERLTSGRRAESGGRATGPGAPAARERGSVPGTGPAVVAAGRTPSHATTSARRAVRQAGRTDVSVEARRVHQRRDELVTRVVTGSRRIEVSGRPASVVQHRAPVQGGTDDAVQAPRAARLGAPVHAPHHPQAAASRVDLDRLTDQIVTRLDSRLTAHRERFGRAF